MWNADVCWNQGHSEYKKIWTYQYKVLLKVVLVNNVLFAKTVFIRTNRFDWPFWRCQISAKLISPYYFRLFLVKTEVFLRLKPISLYIKHVRFLNVVMAVFRGFYYKAKINYSFSENAKNGVRQNCPDYRIQLWIIGQNADNKKNHFWLILTKFIDEKINNNI